ncbi:GNAT family N-acetyltransferase [Mycolicibacterium sp. CBM1]
MTLGCNDFDASRVAVTEAVDRDLDELAAVAATTFPLACPPQVPTADIAGFIAANLSRERFGEYLADDARTLLVVKDAGRIAGYVLLVRGLGTDPAVAAAVQARPAVELSKFYVLPHWHGSPTSAVLMRAAVARTAAGDARSLWLGVNQKNVRAQRFYAKHGFSTAGTRTFQLGGHTEADFVLVRPL